MAHLPPEGEERTMGDFINYCKFQLCVVSHRLMKDAIWEQYDDTEIVAEYYAHVMIKDKDYAEKFLAELKGANPDVYDWLDKMIEDNQTEMETLAQDTEDNIEFTPDSIGE
tara:strand:+ start:26136 stop:26468 length:333 start_codon:yes stop_codon:yes gene_type:complete